MAIDHVQDTLLGSALLAANLTSQASQNFGTNPIVGNYILAFAWGSTALATTVSFTDNYSNTYTIPSGAKQFKAGDLWCAVAYAKIANSGPSFSVTATADHVSSFNVVAAEFAGVKGVSPLDGSGGTTGTTGAPAPGNVTVAAGDVVVAVVGRDSGSYLGSTPTGFTRTAFQNSNLYEVGEAIWAVNPSSPSNPAWGTDTTAWAAAQLALLTADLDAEELFAFIRRPIDQPRQWQQRAAATAYFIATAAVVADVLPQYPFPFFATRLPEAVPARLRASADAYFVPQPLQALEEEPPVARHSLPEVAKSNPRAAALAYQIATTFVVADVVELPPRSMSDVPRPFAPSVRRPAATAFWVEPRYISIEDEPLRGLGMSLPAHARAKQRATPAAYEFDRKQLLPDTAHVTGNSYAQNFVYASGQFLGIADNASLSMGAGVHMTLAGFFQIATKTANRIFAGKDRDTGNQREYEIGYLNGIDRIFGIVYSDGSTATQLNANALGSPATGTWYFVVLQYDGTNLTITINNSAALSNSTAYSGDIFDGTAEFRIGADNAASPSFLDGKASAVGVWKRVLTANELTWLYNSGQGRHSSDFTGPVGSGIKTSLQGWWDLQESDGSRWDASGNHNDLTPTNAPTLTAGPATNLSGADEFLRSNCLLMPDMARAMPRAAVASYQLTASFVEPDEVQTARHQFPVHARSASRPSSEAYWMPSRFIFVEDEPLPVLGLVLPNVAPAARRASPDAWWVPNTTIGYLLGEAPPVEVRDGTAMPHRATAIPRPASAAYWRDNFTILAETDPPKGVQQFPDRAPAVPRAAAASYTITATFAPQPEPSISARILPAGAPAARRAGVWAYWQDVTPQPAETTLPFGVVVAPPSARAPARASAASYVIATRVLEEDYGPLSRTQIDATPRPFRRAHPSAYNWTWFQTTFVVAPAPAGTKVISLLGSVTTTISVTGSVNTSISVSGSPTVAVNANISFMKGEAVTLSDTITSIDITGWALTFSLKRNSTDTTALITKTVGSGITITDPTNGVAQVSLATADTNRAAGVYFFDVWRTDSGNESCLTYGRCEIVQEVRL